MVNSASTAIQDNSSKFCGYEVWTKKLGQKIKENLDYCFDDKILDLILFYTNLEFVTELYMTRIRHIQNISQFLNSGLTLAFFISLLGKNLIEFFGLLLIS